MNYFILFFIMIISAEIIINSNYILLLNLLIKLNKSAIKVILYKKASDHWKEKIIPEYSLRIMRISLSMLLIFLVIILLFLITSILFNNFLAFIFSPRGIISSILFSFIYLYLKRLIKK